MDRKVNILIYPAGGENALEVKESLSYKLNISVFGASSKSDHARFVYKNFSFAPNVAEASFIEAFNKLIRNWKIDFVIPTHDTVALKLSEFHDSLDATVIASGFETNRICRHKKLTMELFAGSHFCPIVYSDASEVNEFPCYVKPDLGEGGKNSYIVGNKEELSFTLRKRSGQDMLITEYLPGAEYTVDCFTDRFGTLRYVGPRSRQRIFGGISVNASTVDGAGFREIAAEINTKMKFRGYWFFQLKEDKFGHPKLMEISARPAGTMSLYRQRGINFMLLSVYDFMGYDYDILDNGYQVQLDRCLSARYELGITYDSIYVDLDDTLIYGGKVNRHILLLLYQARERGIPVILLTKHSDNVCDTLNNYGLSEQLFSRVDQISTTDDKKKYITHKNPIFIDNSFTERARIHRDLQVPVFDTDNVSSLLDWKE